MTVNAMSTQFLRWASELIRPPVVDVAVGRVEDTEELEARVLSWGRADFFFLSLFLSSLLPLLEREEGLFGADMVLTFYPFATRLGRQIGLGGKESLISGLAPRCKKELIDATE